MEIFDTQIFYNTAMKIDEHATRSDTNPIDIARELQVTTQTRFYGRTRLTAGRERVEESLDDLGRDLFAFKMSRVDLLGRVEVVRLEDFFVLLEKLDGSRLDDGLFHELVVRDD